MPSNFVNKPKKEKKREVRRVALTHKKKMFDANGKCQRLRWCRCVPANSQP